LLWFWRPVKSTRYDDEVRLTNARNKRKQREWRRGQRGAMDRIGERRSLAAHVAASAKEYTQTRYSPGG